MLRNRQEKTRRDRGLQQDVEPHLEALASSPNLRRTSKTTSSPVRQASSPEGFGGIFSIGRGRLRLEGGDGDGKEFDSQ